MVQTSLLVLGCNRIHKGAFSAGHRMRTVPVSASPVVNTRRNITPAAQLRRRHRGTCQFSLRALVVQHAGHHPCWKAAHFLPCTRPPDAIRLHRAQRGRIRYGAHARRAFVATRSGFQTMPRRGDEDETTEGAASATARGARGPRFGTRAHVPMTPPAPDRPDTPDDLRLALGAPDSFGVKLFEVNALQAILKACPDVKDAGDLLLLREILLEELGPAYMWLINLSLVDWLSLSDDDKTLNAQMRLDWLASYSKASEAVLQHWFWKLLKTKTMNFAPLHHVFVRVKSGSLNCGSNAWTEIFLLYPLTGASITHKLLARSSAGVIVACRRTHVSTPRCLSATTSSLSRFFLRLAAQIIKTTAPSPFSLKLPRTLCVWAVTLPTTTTFESTFLCLYSVLRCLFFLGAYRTSFCSVEKRSKDL